MTQPLLSAASAPSILLVGEAFTDVYYIGDATRLSPEAPLPIVSIDEIRKLPGGAGNVLENLRAFGAAVHAVTVHAGVKNRLVASGHMLARWDERDGCDGFADQRITFPPRDAQFDAVVVSDYGKGLMSQEALDWLSQYAALPFFIDTKAHPGKYAAFPNATFFPNAKEYAQYAGAYNALKTPFVLKRGADGMEWWKAGADGPVYFARALADHVSSVCGAGDTVVAAFAVNALRYDNPRAALAFAAAAAAAAVERPYTTAPPLAAVHAKLLDQETK